MFRLLLTAYVTLVMLAGPAACCCTTAHVIAGCLVDGSADANKGEAACCCGRHAAAGGDSSGRSVAEDAPGCPTYPGGEPECPCREGTSQIVAEARKQVAEFQQFRSPIPDSPPLTALDAIASETATPDSGAQIRNRASHLGSAREVLRALRAYLI